MSRRTAAALLITEGEGAERTVFLAERNKELRFFGGYWALPGGTIDDEDLYPRGKQHDAVDEDTALRACAHRELFEETGLVRLQLPSSRTQNEGLRELRRQLIAHERSAEQGAASPWPGVIAGTTSPLPMRSLCRIETPAFAPVRYDTVFFHVPLHECKHGTRGRRPDVWPGELVQGRFWLPRQALASWRNGDLLLVPPVVIMLQHLAENPDLEHFARAIEKTTNGYRNGNLHEVRFSPGVVLAPLQTPTLPPATTTNCYVVGHDKLWVVDPGSPDPREQQRLLDLLDELCRDGAELQGVLLTHHHPDHVGGVHALCKARNLRAHGHALTLDRIAPGIPRGDVLDDGARIELGKAPDGTPGWHLEAIHTPGHDRGHLCFRESRYGAMLVGDMMSTISTIIIDPPEGHLATYLQSLEKIGERSISTLYPAHGPAMRDGGKLVQKYLRHRRQRETALLKVLAESPGTLDELLPKVYWDADPRLFPFAARSLQAGLEKLQEEGRAAQQGEVWQLAE